MGLSGIVFDLRILCIGTIKIVHLFEDHDALIFIPTALPRRFLPVFTVLISQGFAGTGLLFRYKPLCSCIGRKPAYPCHDRFFIITI